MKYLDEYRQQAPIAKYLEKIQRLAMRPWTIMEVCGGQTHTILKYQLQELLPKEVELIHGPGCPVCVTPIETIDKAIAIAERPEVILCSFGDMLRVPGSRSTLLIAKAAGADVRTLYSPLDALKIAQDNPAREVVFFGVGFETTAPAIAMILHEAKQRRLQNFSVLASHYLVPPAIRSLMLAEGCRVQGFLAAGHVCTITGYEAYHDLCKKYRVPIVVTGFEPLDLIEGIYLCIQQLEHARAEVENQYSRSVTQEGNREAQKRMEEVFHVIDRSWRGIGRIPQSGLGIHPSYQDFDAEKKFAILHQETQEHPLCISAAILQGHKKPHQCPAFGIGCTPETPLGAPMVSTEGACSAYYRYRGCQP